MRKEAPSWKTIRHCGDQRWLMRSFNSFRRSRSDGSNHKRSERVAAFICLRTLADDLPARPRKRAQREIAAALVMLRGHFSSSAVVLLNLDPPPR
jgi:hypothetical protein